MKYILGLLKFIIIFLVQLFVITFIVYAIFMLSPAVPASLLNSLGATTTQVHGISEFFRFFLEWFWRIVSAGDFGKLASSGDSINNFIWISSRVTLILILGSLLVTLVLSGLVIFLKRRFGHLSPVKGFIFILQTLSSIHYVVLGYFVIVELKVGLDAWSTLYPFLVLGIGNGMLNDMVHVLEEEIEKIFNSGYVQAARARGGNIFKNVVAPLSIALAGVINAKLPMLFGGSFIVEFVLNLEGLGDLILTKGINGQDYNLLLVITFLSTVFIIGVSLLTGQIRKWLDPRPVRVV